MAADFLPERLDVDGLRLAYLDVGSGPETVVFSHSFLVDSRQFEAQIEELAAARRVIAYDHRDHGASDRATAPYDIYDLVADGERVIEALDVAPCHWVGLSTGGFVGMRIALRRPGRLRSLTLMDTSAGAETGVNGMKNRGLLLALRLVGMRPLVGQAMTAMFGPAFLGDEERREERARWRDRISANDRDALVRFGRAIFARDDVLDRLATIDLPVHVIAGAEDRGIPVRHAHDLAEAVPGARLSLIEGAGHLCTIERPDEATELIRSFVDDHGDQPD